MGINSMRDDVDADTGAEHVAEGQWKQFVGEAQRAYGDLDDDWAEQFKGNMTKAMGWLQETYGDAKVRLNQYWKDEYER